ncbi:MAG: DoxX family protein [Gammaproteobacteria bacterium]|nr:DoxX family protein [Gammaproteobacteria bacterium]
MKFLDKFSPHVHWGLRLSLAATFLYHGYTKFPIEAGGFMPVPLTWAVALAELAGGVFLIAGFWKDIITRLGGLIVVVIMIGAIGMVHWKNGWNVMNGGMEFQVLMLVTGLYFLVKGNKV